MLTASWSLYAGPGRVALSPVPPGTVRGYRIAPKGLRLRRGLAAPAVRARLLDLDAAAMWADLHALVYPWTPVLMGNAADPTCTFRRVVADWLSHATGHPIPEMDVTAYRPQRTHPSLWRPIARPVLNTLPRIEPAAHHGHRI